MHPPSRSATGVPVVVSAAGGATSAELCALLTAERSHLESELARAGALLFRGFGVQTPEQLAALRAATGGQPMRYIGGDSPRSDVGRAVYTSTEAPPSIRIPLHNEMSYLTDYPRQLWFACIRPAAEGGETTLADGRAVWRALRPEVRRRFVVEGVRYRFSFRGRSQLWDFVDRFGKVSKTWMEALETSDSELADRRCHQLATRHRWLSSGRVVLELDRPAMVAHPTTGEPGWFNQAHLFHLNARYLGRRNYWLARLLFLRRDSRSHEAHFGDGSEIDAPTLDHLYEVMEAHTISVRWQAGDVLWLDNLACMHGRKPFRGTRRLLVSMSR